MLPIKIGEHAPDFTLYDQNGAPHALNDYAGKWLVLYFYPKALTPGCTTQACDIRDAEAEFNRLNTVVIGVSGDEPAKLKKFEDKEDLNFTLLGDPEHTMLEAYGMWQEKSMYGKKYMGVARSTLIIDPKGVIRHIMPKASPKTHADDVIKWLEKNAHETAA